MWPDSRCLGLVGVWTSSDLSASLSSSSTVETLHFNELSLLVGPLFSRFSHQSCSPFLHGPTHAWMEYHPQLLHQPLGVLQLRYCVVLGEAFLSAGPSPFSLDFSCQSCSLIFHSLTHHFYIWMEYHLALDLRYRPPPHPQLPTQ